MPTSTAGRWYEDEEVAPRADVASNTVASAGTTFTSPFNTEDALAFVAACNVSAISGTSPTLVVSLQSANDAPNTGTYGVQTLTETGNPTGGSFTLTYSGQTTAAIPYNASGAVIQSALAALSNVGVGPQGQPNVIVSGAQAGLGQESPGGVAIVQFANNLVGPQTVTVTDSGLTGGSTPHVTAATLVTGVAAGGTAAVQTIHSTGALSAGTFTLTYGGQTTAPIAFNATATQIGAALAALPNLGIGAITATGGPLTVPTDVTLTFTKANPFNGPATPITVTPSAVTGGVLSIVQTTAGVAAVPVDWYDVAAFALQNAVSVERKVFGPLAAYSRWKVVVGGTGPSVTFDITGSTEKRRS